ncbi:MAG: F0F1 ATP synthase subunit A [Myxococcales bacterium]|nr:F0F1 ATP synthase subunit A [Myxococcales bacterium]
MGHYTWLTLLLEKFKGNLSRNAHMLGESFVGNRHGTWEDFEPITASLLVAVLLILIGMRVRSRLTKLEEAVVPDDQLTLRTFMEAFLGYFYDLSKSVMDADRAKKYFPLIASSACFVFFANVMALIPGMPVPTSNLSITAGSALVVFIAFNAYGLITNGGAYLKHLAGPSPYLAPLMFPIEVISLCVRPVTLAVRLMVNMAVDHLVLTTFMALVAIIVPIPVMLLGCIVVVVQTLVFTLLTTIYIGLATEPMHHDHH